MSKINLQEIKDFLENELVPKAIEIIQRESHDLTITEKVGYNGIKDDLTTNGDKLAQAFYINEITKKFPDFGIIAEEDDIDFNSNNTYFTIDPLDGTKAYERGASQGVGTMIALIQDNKVVSAYVGDINTSEVYGFTEGYPATRKRFGIVTELKFSPKPLSESYVLLRALPKKQPSLINKMIDSGLFRSAEVVSGSIGTTFSRLWKGEVGGLVLEPSFNTPWDSSPVFGISLKLGFNFYRIDGDSVVRHNPQLFKIVTEKNYVDIVIHESKENELMEWLSGN